MINGNGQDDGSGFDTPNDLPQATLIEHRPYVLALINVIAPLQETVNVLSRICHEIRVAQDPVGKKTIEEIGKAGGQLEQIGRSVRIAYGG